MKITERQGRGGMNVSKYMMQLWENEVKPEPLRSLSYLVFPFHSFTDQGSKVTGNVTVVVRGALLRIGLSATFNEHAFSGG